MDLKPITAEVEYLQQFFSYDHLPQHLRNVSKPFCDLSEMIIDTIPKNPERTVALRKLLEAKDCAVRAVLIPQLDIFDRAF